MQNLRVADLNAIDRMLALCDVDGAYHLARACAEMPDIETTLQGPTPMLGRAAHLAASSGQVYRVTFEQLNCSQETVMQCLHPLAPRLRPRARPGQGLIGIGP